MQGLGFRPECAVHPLCRQQPSGRLRISVSHGAAGSDVEAGGSPQRSSVGVQACAPAAAGSLSSGASSSAALPPAPGLHHAAEAQHAGGSNRHDGGASADGCSSAASEADIPDPASGYSASPAASGLQPLRTLSDDEDYVAMPSAWASDSSGGSGDWGISRAAGLSGGGGDGDGFTFVAAAGGGSGISGSGFGSSGVSDEGFWAGAGSDEEEAVTLRSGDRAERARQPPPAGR